MDPDTLRHPVGPLPPHVYWVRRAVLVAAVVVAILLLVNWLAGSGGGAPKRSAISPRSSTSPASSQSSLSSRRPSPSLRASPSPSATRLPRPVATCPDGVLTVTAATDAGSYAPGVRPQLSLRIRNAGTATCRRDLGPGARGLTVRSGSDRIWSSDDCEGTGMSMVTLTPGESRSYAGNWSRHRSRPGCASPGALARPGTYRLYASLDRITTSPAVFLLR